MSCGRYLKTLITPSRISRLNLYPLLSFGTCKRQFSSLGRKMGVEHSTANLALSECRIVVVGPRSGDDSLLELANLPKEARILATGSTLEELRQDGDLFTEGNVILVASGNAKSLAPIVKEMPFLCWIHSTFAGVDHIVCPEIVDNDDIILTNARGVFSSSLAEYVIQACMYFAKDIPRLIRQQQQKNWDRFMVTELKGRTMGIIGYGDIGRACARLAKPFGMKVIGLRRNPSLSEHDRLVDEIVGNDQLNYVIANSDYLVVCLALTPDTKNFIKEENLLHAKKHMILINIGRGALINEDDLIKCLENKTIAGAALDVFSTEPLPETSKFWELPNVLISPHNVDYTSDSRRSSVRHFVQNCERFLRREELDCIVNKPAGY